MPAIALLFGPACLPSRVPLAIEPGLPCESDDDCPEEGHCFCTRDVGDGPVLVCCAQNEPADAVEAEPDRWTLLGPWNTGSNRLTSDYLGGLVPGRSGQPWLVWWNLSTVGVTRLDGAWTPLLVDVGARTRLGRGRWQPLEDRQGRLWLLTDDGVARWDGESWTTPEPTAEIEPAYRVHYRNLKALTESAPGILWFANEEALFRLEAEHGRWSVHAPRGLLDFHPSPERFVGMPGGDVFLVDSRDLVVVDDAGSLRPWLRPEDVPSWPPESLLVDSQGRLWAGGHLWAGRLEDGRLLDLVDVRDTVRRLAEGPGGDIWVLRDTRCGVAKLDDGEVGPFTFLCAEGTDVSPVGLVADGQGALLLATDSDGLRRLPPAGSGDGGGEAIRQDGAPEGSITAVVASQATSVYVGGYGSYGRLARRRPDGDWRSLARWDPSLGPASSILEASDGSVWTARKETLLHVAPGATTGTAVDLGQAITLLFEDPSGDLWAAADAPGTLLRFDGSPTHHPEVLDGPATGVTGLVRGGFRARGTHWLTTRWDGASSGGSVFYSIDLATWQELTVPGLLGPLDRDFIDGCQASTGELWFMSALAVVRVDTDLRARRIPDGLLGLLEAHPLSLLAVECDGQGGVWFLQREALTRRDADGGWFRYLLPSSLPLCPDLRLPGNAGPSHLAVTAVGEVFLGTTCGVLALE